MTVLDLVALWAGFLVVLAVGAWLTEHRYATPPSDRCHQARRVR